MTLPTSLQASSEAAGITDALLRALLGLDMNDRAMFDSAWASDGKVNFEMDGEIQNGMHEIGRTFYFLGHMDTQHLVSNVRVDQAEGASSATIMAYAWAQHHRAGEGMNPTTKHLTTGSRYWIDVEKDDKDGLWKVRKWLMNIMWLDGDASIIARPSSV